MAVTLVSFKLRFPEFSLFLDSANTVTNPDQDARIAAVLAASEASHKRSLFSTDVLADEAIMYYAAHLFARSPFAVNLRIQKSRGDEQLVTGEDIYFEHYSRCIAAAAQGNRVP